MKKIFKNPIFTFILGLIVAGRTVYAVSTIQDSSEIAFDNSGTTLESTTVENALKELSSKVSSAGGGYTFQRLTTSTTTVNCGFRPRLVVVARGMNINYPEVDVIDYANQKGAAAYHSPTGNGGINYDDNGYGYSYIVGGYTLTDTGFTTSTTLDASSSRAAYVWCIK